MLQAIHSSKVRLKKRMQSYTTFCLLKDLVSRCSTEPRHFNLTFSQSAHRGISAPNLKASNGKSLIRFAANSINCTAHAKRPAIKLFWKHFKGSFTQNFTSFESSAFSLAWIPILVDVQLSFRIFLDVIYSIKILCFLRICLSCDRAFQMLLG